MKRDEIEPHAKDESELSDAELDRIFSQLQGDSNEQLDHETARARVALAMIERVRKNGQQATLRGNETIADHEDLDGSILPESIGRFQLGPMIGKGGFGIVFRAFDPNLGREVAIKIPRPEAIATHELKSRFVSEGRAAAALAHPNIVPVYESGQANSICYLASELIEGKTLEETVADDGRFSIADCVTIGLSLTDAISHAHLRGVLHRDIKPSNVLVKDADELMLGERTRITDFGLAKNLNEDLGQTTTGALIGTPSFMATEQAKQEAATPASDIYSIGAVLYWLLTGQAPFLGSGLFETIQMIVNDQVVAPRVRNPSVPRDLESICLKCLEKNPSQRYQSAWELWRDLNRFANGEPVEARTITTGIRVSRWIGRNKFVTGLLAMLAVGVVVSTASFIEARRAQTKANDSALAAAKAESNARTNEQTANEVAKYLASVFKIGNSNTKNAADTTARELLDRAVKNIDDELGEQPEVRYRLMKTMGEAYLNLGAYPDAIRILKGVVDEQVEAESDPFEKVESHVLLGNAYRENGQGDLAIGELEIAIGIFESNAESHLVELANVHNELALVYATRDSGLAIQHLQKARDLNFAADPDSKGIWQLDNNLGTWNYRKGEYQKSLECFQLALEGGIEVHGEDHQRLSSIYGGMCLVYGRLNQLQRANQMGLKSLEIAQNNLPSGHVGLGFAYYDASIALKNIGDLERSSEYSKRAVEIFKDKLPPGHSTQVVVLSSRGSTLALIRDFESSRKIFERQIDLPSDNLHHWSAKNWLAQIEHWEGNHQEAIEAIELVLKEPGLEDFSQQWIDAHYIHAYLLAATQDESAEDAFEKALSLAKKTATNTSFAEAKFWAHVRDPDQCLSSLDRAVASEIKSVYILLPEFDFLRNNPRFQAIEDFMLERKSKRDPESID